MYDMCNNCDQYNISRVIMLEENYEVYIHPLYEMNPPLALKATPVFVILVVNPLNRVRSQ